MMNGDIADVNNADGAGAVNGAVPILVDHADVVMAAEETNMCSSCLQLVDMQIGLSRVLVVLLFTGERES